MAEHFTVRVLGSFMGIQFVESVPAPYIPTPKEEGAMMNPQARAEAIEEELYGPPVIHLKGNNEVDLPAIYADSANAEWAAGQVRSPARFISTPAQEEEVMQQEVGQQLQTALGAASAAEEILTRKGAPAADTAAGQTIIAVRHLAGAIADLAAEVDLLTASVGRRDYSVGGADEQV